MAIWDFDILEIPTQRLLRALFAHLSIPNEQQNKMAVPTEKARRNLSIRLTFLPEVRYLNIFLENGVLPVRSDCCYKGCSNCNNKSCIENEELILFSAVPKLLLFSDSRRVMRSSLVSAQITLKERVYNIISSSPSRQWKLSGCCRSYIYEYVNAQTETCRRRYQFKISTLSARMNQAAKLLRIGNHNVKCCSKMWL